MSLLQAARQGFLEIVRYKCEVENERVTVDVLSVAVSRGHLHIVKYLENKGFFLPFAMSVAARSNQWGLVEYFIECNRDYNLDTALTRAAQYGNIQIVRRVLESGCANIHSMDDFALRMSAERGFVEIVLLLLQHSANVHGGNNYALIHASRNGHFAVVRLLVDYGAHVTVYDSRAMRFAAREGHLNVVRLLVERGSDVHALGDQAFCHAVDYNHLDIVKFLVEECGVNPCVNGGYGTRWAAIYAYRELEKYLWGVINVHRQRA